MTKKIIALLLCICMCLAFSGCKKEKYNAAIYDANGKTIVNFDKLDNFKSANATYVDIAVQEALSLIAQIKKIDTEDAKKLITEYDIYTYLDKDLVTAIETSYQKVMGSNFGCAIIDLEGKIIAVYSASPSDSENFVLKNIQQHSTMKPLSVYAPAIENRIITWSSLTEDSPYKVLTNSKGVNYDWPINASGKYSYSNMTAYHALQESINTVAVKILGKYGVNKSISFLQENFNLDLTYEQQKSTIYGEDEIVGNIALGATVAGSTPIDMAGYYQIFANGGKYTAPKSVKKIVDKKGKVIYQNKSESKQVLSAETSYLMNEMLRGVTRSSGTGAAASVNGIQIAGKTGTGSGFSDNWFVGVTPEYSCAVWHSNIGRQNMAAKVFSVIVENSDIKQAKFTVSQNVEKKIYCKDSGMLLGTNCKNAELGYYLKDNIPFLCNVH